MASKNANNASNLGSIVEHPSWNVAQRNYFRTLQDALPVVMGYLETEIPVLTNHTDNMLVDETGVLKKVKKVVEKAEKAHVERLKARMGNKKTLRGSVYEAAYRGAERTILNQGECKALIELAEENQLNLKKLVGMVVNQEIQVPNDVWLQDDGDTEGSCESNRDTFFTTSPGNALYVEALS